MKKDSGAIITTDISTPAPAPSGAMATARGEARAVARMQPRDQKLAYQRILADARRGGSAYHYAWTVKTKDGPQLVRGPSVWCVLGVMRLWGNIDAQTAIEEDDGEAWVIRATAMDLEAGVSMSTLFRQRKQLPGMEAMGRDRALDIAFQIGQAKAIRNAVTRILPRWLVDDALAASVEGAKARAAGKAPQETVAPNAPALPAARKAAFWALAQHGVTPEMIERRLGHPAGEATAEEVAELQAIATALEEGQTSVANEFMALETPTARPDVADTLKTGPKANGNGGELRTKLLGVAYAAKVPETELREMATAMGVDLEHLTPEGFGKLVQAITER
jgi:hypothetical protein